MAIFRRIHSNIYIYIIVIIIMMGKREDKLKEMNTMSESNEVVLWMEKCAPERLTANKVLLCTRNIFLLENMRDIIPEEYHAIIQSSSSAGIVKL